MPDPIAAWKDLCIDAVDPSRLARFWSAALAMRVDRSHDVLSLAGAAAHERIRVNAVDRPQQVKHRVHLDLYAASVGELEALGARTVATTEETGHGWTLMVDPEGGEFCCFVRETPPRRRLHGIGIDCVDPAASAAWWGRVLGRPVTTYDGHDDLFTLEGATPDEVLTLDFAAVPEPRHGPNRVHWDVVGDVAALEAAGATRLWETSGWTVLADPEGNEFCVFAAG